MFRPHHDSHALSYAALVALETLLTAKLRTLRADGASVQARFIIARWLANVVIRKAAMERQGKAAPTLFQKEFSMTPLAAPGATNSSQEG